MTYNGFGLAEGGDFEIRMLKFTIIFNRIPNAQPCNSAPLLANPCWQLPFLLSLVYGVFQTFLSLNKKSVVIGFTLKS